jgi:hypothetical protein
MVIYLYLKLNATPQSLAVSSNPLSDYKNISQPKACKSASKMLHANTYALEGAAVQVIIIYQLLPVELSLYFKCRQWSTSETGT